MEDKSLRKRQQIAKANRMMFMWVAGTSVLVGFALVAAVFLGQKLLFNEKVLAEKSNTVSTLKANNEAIEELERNVRLLNTNKGLIESKAKDNDQAIQVVLDALPADANPLAFGSSLQQVLLADIDGLTVEDGLQVQSIDDTTFDESEYVEEASEEIGEQAGQRIGFRFTVSGDAKVLTEVLKRLERSIRAIDLTSLEIESQNNRLVLSVAGHTYYEPARTIELKEKAVSS